MFPEDTMLLIQNCRLVDPASHTDGMRDILLSDGLVKTIAPAGTLPVPEGGTVIKACGAIAAPGLVDTHSHFRDPGFPKKEDIHTGSLSAAKGGYTSIIMMANTKPPIDSVPILSDVLARGEKEKIRIYSAANVTVGMQGEARTDFVSLKEAGAVVFTDDGRPITDASLLRSALKLARKLDMPVSLHEEDPAFVKEPGVNAGGKAAASLCLTGADRKAESSLVARDVKIAEEVGGKLLIQHIGSKEGVALVREAQKVNPLIQAEATPQHFSLTEDAVLQKGTLAKVNPPLRLEEDRQAILAGIADGTIRIIATDHAPHTRAEKSQTFPKAPSGMIGLETALSLGLKNLVRPGVLSLKQFLAMLTVNPAAYYKLPAGKIYEGGPADLLLFDPDKEWTVTDSFASRSSNSPFIGETLPGVVLYTICRGEIAYQLGTN